MTNILALRKYAYFTNKEDMDRATRQHVDAHREKLNKSDLAVLERIRQHSVSQCATKLLVSTIATAINKSTITVRRALSKLVKLEIIERTSTFRTKVAGQGASILAIKPFRLINDDMPELKPSKAVEKPVVCMCGAVKSEPVSSSFISKPGKQSFHESTPTEQTLYQRMQSILSNTIGNNKEARRIYGAYRAHAVRQLRFEHNAHKGDLINELSIQALNKTVRRSKHIKLDNMTAYFDTVLRDLLDKHFTGGDPFLNLLTH